MVSLWSRRRDSLALSLTLADTPGRSDNSPDCRFCRPFESLSYLLHVILFKKRRPVGVLNLWSRRRDSLALSLSLADKPGRSDNSPDCRFCRPFESLPCLLHVTLSKKRRPVGVLNFWSRRRDSLALSLTLADTPGRSDNSPDCRFCRPFESLSYLLHVTLFKKKTPCRRLFLVEETGFEPTASWSRTKRATKLRYSSLFRKLF